MSKEIVHNPSREAFSDKVILLTKDTDYNNYIILGLSEGQGSDLLRAALPFENLDAIEAFARRALGLVRAALPFENLDAIEAFARRALGLVQTLKSQGSVNRR